MAKSNKYATQNNAGDTATPAVADRLKLAADTIRASRQVPETSICDAIGDAEWFREYCNTCLQHPIANAFLGCILFGWQLGEEYRRLECESPSPKVYRA